MKYVNQTNQESYERMNVMNKMKTRIGVVSMATLAMSGSVAGSAIAAISKSFPDTPISTIQLLSTLPGVGSLIITLVAGQMAMRVSKKSLVLLGVALVTLGGLVPAFWNSSVAGLLACSVILGMGVGFISTLNPMILTQYFEGEERSSMMGFNTGMTSLGTMILTGVGGFLGGSNWRHLYWVFAFGIVVFLLVLFCLPKDGVIRESFNGSHEKVEKESTWQIFKGLNPYVYWVCSSWASHTLHIWQTFQSSLQQSIWAALPRPVLSMQLEHSEASLPGSASSMSARSRNRQLLQQALRS